jgi:hypothetical protein
MVKVEELFPPVIMRRENLEFAVQCQYPKHGGDAPENHWEMRFTIAVHIDYTVVHLTA